MNARIFAILLVVVCLGLGIGWYKTSQQADSDRRVASETQSGLSNNLVSTTAKLNEQLVVNASLNTNLDQRISELNLFSNKWTYVTSELTRTEAEARAAAEAARLEIEKRDKAIAGLEGEKDELTKKMGELTGQIGSLEAQIQETERKLAASEGDRELLKRELKRLLAEKAELERKFNDLAVLREQVRKLKEELSIARRLDFIRRGLYGFDKKGGQLMRDGIKSPSASTLTNYNLKVDVGTDGSVKAQTETKPASPSP
jgi:chromosome segregation ATPase